MDVRSAAATGQIVRIASGHAAGTVGVLRNYNVAYDAVKVGFLDEDGNYNGDYTTTSASSVKIA